MHRLIQEGRPHFAPVLTDAAVVSPLRLIRSLLSHEVPIPQPVPVALALLPAGLVPALVVGRLVACVAAAQLVRADSRDHHSGLQCVGEEG